MPNQIYQSRKIAVAVGCFIVAYRELARVRAAYNATFLPGIRRVWDLA